MQKKLLFTSILVFMLNMVLANPVSNSHLKNTLDPIVIITGNTTILSGNNTILTITTTPNNIVKIVSSTLSAYYVNVGNTGIATFTTPILQETTTFTIVEVRDYITNIATPITDVSITINVITNGCTTIGVDVQNDNPQICSIGECINLTAIPTPVPSTTSYEVISIPYYPQASFNDPLFNQLPLTTDDTYSPVFPLPFNFCFYGNTFSTVQIGANGVISFGTNYTSNTYTQNLSFTDPQFPVNGSGLGDAPFRNMICGVFQDTNASEIPPTDSGFVRSVNYQVIGTYPCRKLIVNFNLGQFQCGYTNGEQSSQIVLYEVSNIIEVYIKNRTPCNSHQSGRGVIGIKGSGDNPPYAIAPGRDSGNWTATNEAWRFTPNGPEVPYTLQWFENGTPISTDLNISVCPKESKTYVANVVYDLCGNNYSVNSNDTNILVIDNNFQEPENLSVCYNSENNYTVDLTQNNSIILENLEPINFEIYYFTNFEDAVNWANPISNPVNYSFSQNETIFVLIFDILNGCSSIKSFELNILEEVAPPTGESIQLYIAGQTLNDLIVTGENIIWYDAPIEGNQLPSTTLVQDNTTYYVSQTVNSCESRMSTPQRLAILVTSSLDTNSFELNNITLTPNPFNDIITFDFKNEKGILEIFTILGQKMYSFEIENGNNTINLNSLNSGIYFFKITSDKKSKTFKLLKK